MSTRKGNLLIKGQGASPGITEGEIVVIRDISEFKKMKDGRVLVTIITSPPWMSVMLKARAVVTDKGGVLSHPAIVCRELGIPAVVGANDATNKLQDGTKVIVDGFKGEIYEKK